MATQAQIAAVQQLYIGYLGRAADKAGLDFWTNAVATGVSTLESVATGFTLSNEYKAAFGGLTNDALVEKVYTSVLGRASDTAGKAFWVDALAKGTVTADKLVATFIGALGAPDQTIINNKTFVAQTYTDTVGANYNGAAGASVIAGVDGTAASVTTALANISNGTLTGLVPGVALINAIAAANAVKTAYGVEAATTNPTFDTLKADGITAGKDGVVDANDAAAAALKASNDRANIKVGGVTVETSAAAQTLATANTALASQKALAQANGASTSVAAFDAAVATQKSLIGTATMADAKAAAVLTESSLIAAADVALTANAGVAGTVNYATLTAAFNNATVPAGSQALLDSASLKTLLDGATTASKTALTAELAKLPTYGSATVDAAAKVSSLLASEAAVGTAAAPGTAAAGVTDYAKAVLDQAAAADIVAKITVADAAVAAAKVVVDKYVALDSNIEIAQAALNTFKANNSDKVTITDIAGVNSTTQATAKSDVFYFNTKAVATNDFAIGGTTNFAAGDSIVLGTGYTFNSGALSTGNANALEFFLVKGATGTQVVIETEAYGNASTTVDNAGNVIASPNATVINLVGVTADHLSVANGVVSYV